MGIRSVREQIAARKRNRAVSPQQNVAFRMMPSCASGFGLLCFVVAVLSQRLASPPFACLALRCISSHVILFQPVQSYSIQIKSRVFNAIEFIVA